MKIYLDTSVFGGYFDKAFREDTIQFFNYLNEKDHTILYSDINAEEIKNAPQKVKELIASLENIEHIKLTNEMDRLANLYIQESALKIQNINDAQHIAVASVAAASVLVSWNFKHMVNFFRIKQYNAINLKEGYRIIHINTPKETLEHGENSQ